MSKRFAGLERELLYTSASCVVASSVSFASAQVRKLTHAAVPPFPTKLCFAGTPEQADFALCANPDSVRIRTKSACPTVAEKCLSTAICPHSRWRSQPLPGVSRKQRYNTLDFPRESRVPRKALPSFGNLPPRGTLFPSRLPLPTGMLLAPIG